MQPVLLPQCHAFHSETEYLVRKTSLVGLDFINLVLTGLV